MGTETRGGLPSTGSAGNPSCVARRQSDRSEAALRPAEVRAPTSRLEAKDPRWRLLGAVVPWHILLLVRGQSGRGSDELKGRSICGGGSSALGGCSQVRLVRPRRLVLVGQPPREPRV